MVIFAAKVGLFRTFEYEIIANNILNGSGYTIKHLGVIHYSLGPPLFTLISALIYSITNHSQLALGLVQVFFSAVVCVVIFKIGEQIFERRVAFVAATMTIFHPGLVLYITRLSSFSTDALLFVLLIFTLLKVKQTFSIIWFILFGLISGLCLLSRSTVFLFLPVVFVFLWLRAPDRKRILRYSILSCIIILIIVGPWFIRNHIVLKKFIFIQECGEVFWRGNNPNATGTSFSIEGKPMINTISEEVFHGLSGIEQDRLFWKEGFKFIKSHPGQFLILTAKKFYYFWWFSPHSGIWYPHIYLPIYRVIYTIMLLLAVLGIMAALTSKIPRITEGVYLMLIFFFVISVSQSLFYVEGRHRLAIEPLLLIFTANGIFYLLKRKSRERVQ